jgi:L-asparaginase II
MQHLTIVQTRNQLPETFHPVSAVLVEQDRVLLEVGEPISCFWRSGCKPFQLMTSLANLPTQTLNWLKEEDLALGSSSHSGEPEHVARVLRLLRHFKLKSQQLQCGAHLPINEAASKTLLGRRKKPTTLHSNCSGKHTFMLAASLYQGWEADYRSPDHPLQQQNIATITRWSGQAPGLAVDGCGVPTFHLPIAAMAQAFSGLALSMQQEPQSLPGRIGWAMHRHPQFTSGSGRLDRLVVEGSRVPLTVKVGAEGLFSIAVPDRGWGLVIKVASGSNEALAVAVHCILERVLPDCLEGVSWPWSTVKNVVGAVVGSREGVWGE